MFTGMNSVFTALQRLSMKMGATNFGMPISKIFKNPLAESLQAMRASCRIIAVAHSNYAVFWPTTKADA